MKPLFSIVTVTYNAGLFLEKTLQSILKQSYDRLELIIVDGNSTDNTVEIIRNYQSDLVIWISEPDKGLYDAMNKGLEMASGDYVWFVNAGDVLYNKTTITDIVNQLELNNWPDIIYGETNIVDQAGNFIQKRRLKAPEKLNWKSFKMGMLVCHQSFIVKKESAEPYNLDYRYASDYDWSIRCMKKAKTLFNTHLVLSEFAEGGISTINKKDGLKERFTIMSHYYGKIPTILRHAWFAVRFLLVK